MAYGTLLDMAEARTYSHRPVMLAETVELFSACADGTIVDATLGGGGHSEALLAATPEHKVIGIDRDPAAIAAATARLADFGNRFSTVRARFDDGLAAIGSMAQPDDEPIVGVLFDLGVSSPQLDFAERGFSYRSEAPLDMRMDPTEDRSAADIVNTYDAQALARVLKVYGDERFAGRVARAIVDARPITTTTQLAEIVRSAIPAATRRHGGHPAKRTFQALRIEVNNELSSLERALLGALDVVVPGGRIVAISYHSGEDRRVKAAFRDAIDGGCSCPPGLPCGCGAVSVARNLTRGGLTPTEAELIDNPRAQSARLRAVEVLP